MPSAPAQSATPRQTALVLFGVALLMVLAGFAAMSESSDARLVDGKVLDLICNRLRDDELRCRPVVEFADAGRTRRFESKLLFFEGDLQVGAPIPVDVAQEPPEMVSASHSAGFLLAMFGGGGLFVLFGLSQWRKRKDA